MGDTRRPRLTPWLDDRRVDELLTGMSDQERSREIFEFIAERRRATHSQLRELVTAMEGARAEAESVRGERDRLQEQVNELQNRVFQAESEAAALREARPQAAAVAKAARWVVTTGRSIRRTGG